MTEPDAPRLDQTGQLEFPCIYPVKAMTHVRDQALGQVLAQIEREATVHDAERIGIRVSRNGRYQSLTVAVRVESRSQLEAVYAALRQLDVVVMTL